MTIRHARVGDIPRLTALWQEAFGDSPELIAKFFRTGFAPERSAVAGDGMGALYWFDCLWKNKKIAYVYAVATGKAFRGRGVCRALMDWTHGHLRENGYAGAILVPADEDLTRMYGKMGYREIATGASARAMTKDLEEISAEEYMALRQGLLPEGAVAHTEAAFRYMATFMQFYKFPGGIFCGDPEKPVELLPWGQGEKAMYLPLDGGTELPGYFALGMG